MERLRRPISSGIQNPESRIQNEPAAAGSTVRLWFILASGFWLLDSPLVVTGPPKGGGGTIGGFGTSSWTGSNSNSSNRIAGAMTDEVVTKVPAPIKANGAFESMKLKT